MHKIVRQMEKDKAKEMAERMAAERKAMQSAENRRRNPLKGTSYPKDYKPVILVPIPPKDPEVIWEEKAREEIRRIPIVIEHNRESAGARYE